MNESEAPPAVSGDSWTWPCRCKTTGHRDATPRAEHQFSALSGEPRAAPVESPRPRGLRPHVCPLSNEQARCHLREKSMILHFTGEQHRTSDCQMQGAVKTLSALQVRTSEKKRMQDADTTEAKHTAVVSGGSGGSGADASSTTMCFSTSQQTCTLLRWQNTWSDSWRPRHLGLGVRVDGGRKMPHNEAKIGLRRTQRTLSMNW